MSEDTVRNFRLAESITNLSHIKNQKADKSKPTQKLSLYPTNSSTQNKKGDTNDFRSISAVGQKPKQTSPALSVLLREGTPVKRSLTRLQGRRLPWLDGNTSSVTSEHKDTRDETPEAFYPTGITQSSIPISRDFASEPLYETKIFQTSPAVAKNSIVENDSSDESNRYDSSMSSDISTVIMPVPIDVRKLGGDVAHTGERGNDRAFKVVDYDPRRDSATARRAVVNSPHEPRSLSVFTDTEHAAPASSASSHRSSAVAYDYTRDDPSKFVIDFHQNSTDSIPHVDSMGNLNASTDAAATRLRANTPSREAPKPKAKHKLSYVEPVPVSDAASFSSSLAYDVASVTSLDVDMEGNIGRSSIYAPNMSLRHRAPEIKIGESARSFRRSSLATPNLGPDEYFQNPKSRRQTPKRVSFHPGMPG